MGQGRDPPAFQEYAAHLMALTEYRVLDMACRGMLMSMRLECWVNRTVPSAPRVLSKVLGCDVGLAQRALVELAPFFAVDGDKLHCPELDKYRAHLEEESRKKSVGGKAGAAKTNALRNAAAGNPTATPQVSRGSLVKQSPVQLSKDKSLEGKATEDPWLSDYERASRGY